MGALSFLSTKNKELLFHHGFVVCIYFLHFDFSPNSMRLGLPERVSSPRYNNGSTALTESICSAPPTIYLFNFDTQVICSDNSEMGYKSC